MGLNDLLLKLEVEAVTSVTAHGAQDVTAYPASTLAVTPVTPVTATNVNAGMTPPEEAAFRHWCSFIGEHDAELIDDALERCRVDPVALAYFLARSIEVLQPIADDRRPCSQCANLNGGGRCVAAQRGLVDAPSRYSPHPTILRRCAAYLARDG